MPNDDRSLRRGFGSDLSSAQQLFEQGAFANRPARYNEQQLPFEDEDEQLSLFPEPMRDPGSSFEAIPAIDEDDEADSGNPTARPAALSLIPTSTINPARPRTLAAGYDRDTKTLTVMFRDGVIYNYYTVTPLQWSNFARARSKGRFIYTYLDQLPRGYADEGSLGEVAKSILANVAAQAQAASRGLQAGHSAASNRGERGSYRTGNIGGTGRRRLGRDLDNAANTYWRNK